MAEIYVTFDLWINYEIVTAAQYGSGNFRRFSREDVKSAARFLPIAHIRDQSKRTVIWFNFTLTPQFLNKFPDGDVIKPWYIYKNKSISWRYFTEAPWSSR